MNNIVIFQQWLILWLPKVATRKWWYKSVPARKMFWGKANNPIRLRWCTSSSEHLLPVVVFARSNSCIYSYPNIPGKTIYTICVNFYPLNDHLYEIEDLNTKHNFQNLKITVLEFFCLDVLFKEKLNETSYFAQKLVGYEYMCKLCSGVYVFFVCFFFSFFFSFFFFFFFVFFFLSLQYTLLIQWRAAT